MPVKVDISRKELLSLLGEVAEDNREYEDLIHLLLEERLSTEEEEEEESFGMRAAEKVAGFAGSWVFLLLFGLCISLWMLGNLLLGGKAFDPFPFILLNLTLSCLTALQAPLIMMSQNKQSRMDRKQAKSNYKVSLKSELILEDLHQKLDLVLTKQRELERRLDDRENS